MESFPLIESGIIFSIRSLEDIKKVSYKSADFSIHGEAFSFLLAYYDDYKKFPPQSLLLEKFPILDPSAIGIDLDYCLDNFQKQVLYRRLINSFQSNKELLLENPKEAIGKIFSSIDLFQDLQGDNIQVYDAGEGKRHLEYLARKEKRSRGLKIIGIPTMFRSLNRTGIGWNPGEVISCFARPTLGKTWLCIKSAAVAVNFGYKTLFISAEMPVSQIALRMDVMLGKMKGFQFSHTNLRRGELTQEEENQYKQYLVAVKSRKLLLCDQIDNDMVSLAGIQSAIRKHRPDFLVLDGIQLVRGGNNKNAVWERMHELFYGIKSLSIKYNLSSFVTTQANRSASNIYSPPKASDVSLGDALIQASDIALSLSLVEDQEKKRLIQIQKYRDGDPAINYFMLDWDVNNGIIIEEKQKEQD